MAQLWSREPVRTAIYPMIVLIVAYLVQRGIVDSSTRDFVLALTALALGAAGVEAARAKVSPVAGEQS